jgi:hypothetical protein
LMLFPPFFVIPAQAGIQTSPSPLILSLSKNSHPATLVSSAA